MYFELNSLAVLKIRELQKQEGFEPCFGTKEKCNELCCCWRQICKPAIKPFIKLNIVE